MSIVERLQHKYALSEQGAKDMIKAFAACTFANLAQMMPVGILFMMTGDLLNGQLPKSHVVIFIGGSIICLALIAITEYFQYNATFFHHGGLRNAGDSIITLAPGACWSFYFYNACSNKSVFL